MAQVTDTAKFKMLLRKLRNQTGLGANQLASYVGVSGAEISRIERGETKKINPKSLRQLAPKLDVSYEYLMHEAGYGSDKTGEKGETCLVPAGFLTHLDQNDRKLVLDLIERLSKDSLTYETQRKKPGVYQLETLAGSTNHSGGSVWESNPPRTLLTPHRGFEDQEAHQD